MWVTTIFSRPNACDSQPFTVVSLTLTLAFLALPVACREMMKKRPAAREACGASAKKPPRHPSRFTLRFLKYAVGDPSIVGTPQHLPAFATVFFEYLNAFPVEDDAWMENGAVPLCALAMYTLYFIKFTFIGGDAPKKTDQDAGG